MKLGSCGELRHVVNHLGVGKSTVCTILQEVCRAICRAYSITFPTGDALQRVADGFMAKGTLPGCCGVVDGSHIPIKAPIDNAKDFFCRKQFHSIVLQAVIDSDVQFMNINVGWPGSVHDARILRNSNLYTAGEAGRLFLPRTVVIENEPLRPFIMGDSAYPALTWLKRPYVGALNAFMIAYNRKLSKGRAAVEHAFGQLKGRWRCLLKQNDSSLENVKLQVNACCILHNLCKLENDQYLEEWGIVTDSSSDESE